MKRRHPFADKVKQSAGLAVLEVTQGNREGLLGKLAAALRVS
jgi:nucleoside-triphosphatase THEP1